MSKLQLKIAGFQSISKCSMMSLAIFFAVSLVHSSVLQSVSNPWTGTWLEAESKFVIQLLGPCRLSNFSALVGNMELCSTSCLVRRHLLFFLNFFVILINSKVVFIAYSRDKVPLWSVRQQGAPAARPSCVTLVWQWRVSGGKIWN